MPNHSLPLIAKQSVIDYCWGQKDPIIVFEKTITGDSVSMKINRRDL